MKRKTIVPVILAAVIFGGCASTKPTSRVGIVNGKYAIKSTVPNNNKGKKVNLTGGQSYSCESSLVGKDGKQVQYTFDLKISQDGNHITWYNDKEDGVTPETSYIGKLVFKRGLGFVETTKHDQVMLPSRNNTGNIATFSSVKDAKKFVKITQKFQNGKITKSEWRNQMRKQKVRVYESVCTQTTNNAYTQTRYLTDHEINAYQHNQQIAVQQKAISDANWNATMSQINYNNQQMLNRSNTYNVNIVGY